MAMAANPYLPCPACQEGRQLIAPTIGGFNDSAEARKQAKKLLGELGEKPPPNRPKAEPEPYLAEGDLVRTAWACGCTQPTTFWIAFEEWYSRMLVNQLGEPPIPVDRHGPCPCKSGKKFKKCCGKQERRNVE